MRRLSRICSPSKFFHSLELVVGIALMLYNCYYRKIQEEGLRTYLFTYAPFYSTLSLQHLASTFDLPLSTATSLVSKMIWNEELDASLDQVVGVVVLQSSEVSQLQRLALQLAEKASQMADGSERVSVCSVLLFPLHDG